MATNVPFNPLEGERPELNIKMHDGSDEQVSIFIVHKDRPEYLNICLQSIAVTSINNNYEIIVIDNNSGQESQDFLDSIEHFGDTPLVNTSPINFLQAKSWCKEASNIGIYLFESILLIY